MAVTVDTPTTYTCVDPTGLRHEPKETESAGVIRGRADNGYFTTTRADVAQELQERYPQMLITTHETLHGGKRTRSVMFVMPDLPWKKHTETQTGAVTPQEEPPNVSEHAPE